MTGAHSFFCPGCGHAYSHAAASVYVADTLQYQLCATCAGKTGKGRLAVLERVALVLEKKKGQA
jgi:hypothetical protein